MRKHYLDELRVLCMIAVVLDHVGATGKTDFAGSYVSAPGFVFQAITYICHFAVPIFLMISGTLFLNPDKEIGISKLYSHYIKRYVIVLFLFGGVFSLMELVMKAKTVKLSFISKAILNVIEGNTWDHMWYLYAYIGILLILPMLKSIVNCDREGKILNYSLIISIVIICILPIIENIFLIDVQVDAPFVSIFPVYFLLGYWLSDEKKHIFKKTTLYIVIGMCSAVLVASAYFAVYSGGNTGLQSYSSPIILILASAIFLLYRDKKIEGVPAWIRSVSALSFGVYLIHMFFFNMIFKVFHLNPYSLGGIMGFAIAVVVLVCSIVGTYILKKLPGFKKLV